VTTLASAARSALKAASDAASAWASAVRAAFTRAWALARSVDSAVAVAASWLARSSDMLRSWRGVAVCADARPMARVAASKVVVRKIMVFSCVWRFNQP